jgi:hypothetical protein
MIAIVLVILFTFISASYCHRFDDKTLL